MIQFNLLPDVKLEYERAKRIQRMMTLISVVVTVVALLLMSSLWVVVGVIQHNEIHALNQQISKNSANLVGKKNLNQILTIQNQLESLTSLHNKKPAATRLFNYLTELTPVNANITKLKMDFDKHTMEISGTADKFSTLNQFVDTLKVAQYEISGKSITPESAFSNVVLSQFSVVNTAGSSGVTYTIDVSYNADLFDITKKINLIVPNMVVNRPSALFIDAPKNTTPKASKQ